MDIKDYKSGRFSYLMDKPFAKDLWNFLSDDVRLNLMFSATKAGKPAIEFFLADLESQFGEALSFPEYPKEEVGVFVNNMIKQIMENRGFGHVACGICRNGRYIKSSGVYRKVDIR